MSTKYYGSLILKTPSITASQGDYTSVNDAAQQQYPLGCIWVFPDSNNCPRIIKYVQYNPTAAATWTQGAQLYYKDNTRTVVTNKTSEADTYVASSPEALYSFAGVSLNLAAPTAGNFIWIQVAGFCPNLNLPSGAAQGDLLVLANSTSAAPTDNTYIRIAAGADLTLKKADMASIILTTSAVGSSTINGGWIRNPGFIF